MTKYIKPQLLMECSLVKALLSQGLFTKVMVTESNEIKFTDYDDMSELIYALKPVFYLEYFYGVYRFRINGDKIQKIWKNIKPLIFLVSVMVLTLHVFLLLKFFTVSSTDYFGAVADIINKLPLIFIVLDHNFFVNITSLLHCDHNLQLFRGLNEIDHNLNIKANQNVYRKTRIICLRIAVSLLVGNLVYIIINMKLGNVQLIYELFFSVTRFIIEFELFFFCALVHMVELRLKVINHYLTKIVDKSAVKSFQVFTITNNILYEPIMIKRAKLIDLVPMYELIGKTYNCVNKVFSFHILMILIINLAYMIISIWTLVYYEKKSEETTVTTDLIMHVIGSTMCLFELISMCYVCSNVLTTRSKTQTLVMEIVMDYKFPKKLRRQAKSFLALLKAWPLRIVLCDIFSIDITLILKFVSVSTTYLIIVLQISHFL